MAAPNLLAIHNARPHTLARLPALPRSPALTSFLVTRSGRHCGVDYGVGDVVVCADSARHGDEVVLVACGYGRPRFGHIAGVEIIGDVGERCHPGRWRAIGKVVGVMREELGGWVLQVREGCDVNWIQASFVRASPHAVATPSEQLALFERAA